MRNYKIVSDTGSRQNSRDVALECRLTHSTFAPLQKSPARFARHLPLRSTQPRGLPQLKISHASF